MSVEQQLIGSVSNRVMGRPVVHNALLDALLCPWQQHGAMPLMKSDKQQYYWQLQCNKHVQLCTTQAAAKQLAAHGCLRCDRCDVEVHPAQRSQFERCAWLALQNILGKSDVQMFMASLMPNLTGQDMGYVVEAKVLRGTLGAADMYIPSLDMIIQVDGQHHDQLVQMSRDARFDAVANEQHRAMLRLHHEDMQAFHQTITEAVMRCIRRCQDDDPWKSLIMYSASHQQQTRPTSSVTLE